MESWTAREPELHSAARLCPSTGTLTLDQPLLSCSTYLSLLQLLPACQDNSFLLCGALYLALLLRKLSPLSNFPLAFAILLWDHPAAHLSLSDPFLVPFYSLIRHKSSPQIQKPILILPLFATCCNRVQKCYTNIRATRTTVEASLRRYHSNR